MTSDGAVLEGATPILQVVDLTQALAWYHKVLGFKTEWTCGDPPDCASVCRDGAEVNLTVPSTGQLTISRVYFETRGVDAYYDRVSNAGAHIAVAIGDRPYGMRDFRVVDPAGNELSFGEPTHA